MNRKGFPFFCIKAILFISSLALLLLPLAVKIHDYEKKYKPRSAIFNKDIDGYSYALVGDSLFCSYYVNDDSDAIWNKFESFTGKKMFPGAIDSVANPDFVAIAEYIAYKMPAHSTVFIDILPTRFITHGRFEKGNYEYEFAELWKKEKFVIYKYLRYWDLDYGKYVCDFIDGKKTDRSHGASYNRIWNIDGDFAKRRYKALNTAMINKADTEIPLHNENYYLAEINRVFHEKKIYAIFVLMPLNKKEIYTYSEKTQANRIYYEIEECYKQTKVYLKEISAEYIDLMDAVPENCFADLFHTNACGDEIIAKALADYVSRAGN